jgi:hypothetical protein
MLALSTSHNFVEGALRDSVNRFTAGVTLPTSYRDVNIEWIEFDTVELTANSLSR